MTCIVGIKDKNSVFIGADSVAGQEKQYHLSDRKDPKVFIRKPFIFGFTTSYRMGQLLAYHLEIPSLPEGDITHKWMCTVFVDSVRNCLEKGGYAQKENNVETGGAFLVGVHGQLFEIDDDYQVGIPGWDIAAIGCGYSYALGSLFSTAGNTPVSRIKKALEAAEHYSAYVRRPFKILKV